MSDTNAEMTVSAEAVDKELYLDIAPEEDDLHMSIYGSVANNLTTTDEGYVLDARQGKVLADRLGSAQGTLSSVEKTVNSHTGQITSLETATKKNTGSISQHTAQIASLSGGVSANAANLANLSTAVKQNAQRITDNAIAISDNRDAVRAARAVADASAAEAKKKAELYVSQITLPTAGWVNKTQTIEVAALGDDAKKVDVSAAPVSRKRYQAACVSCTGSTGNKLTFVCLHEPKDDLYVNIGVYR